VAEQIRTSANCFVSREVTLKEEQVMKKLAAALVLTFFASSAYAQVVLDIPENSRMMGMGVSNVQIEDDYNIWINPAQISNYSNMVTIEFGHHSPGGGSFPESPDAVGAWGGIHSGTDYGTWGVYLGRPYHDPMGMYGLVSAGMDANRLDLFYAPAGVPAGFYVSYANESDDGPDDDSTEFNLGGGVNLMGGSVELAADIGIANADVGGVEEDMIGVGVLARHHGDAGAAGKLISNARVAFRQFGESEVDVLQIGVGTALNARPNNETLVVTGIGIEYEDVANGVDFSGIAVPVNIGVEHQTFKRAKTRAGVNKDIYHSEDDGSSTVVSDGYATVAVGLGVDVTDNLVVDWVVNRDILFSGTHLVSGVEETLASYVTGTWRFE
jgi:hypothetical protein